MAILQVDIEEFLSLQIDHPVLDVRSPAEYAQAHIPGAYNIPLFTDVERQHIGTLYKQQSRQLAVRKGLDYFGPKMNLIIETAESIIKNVTDERKPGQNIALVHCWRGGMRSAGMAWLLDLYGIKVFTLRGGYKAFRKWAIAELEKPWRFKCLGGYTGSAKTYCIEALEKRGVPTIHLERIAKHKGSAFGKIGDPESQPSQEMFENILAKDLYRNFLRNKGIDKEIWIEDESQRIGMVNIPQILWENLKESELIFLNIPFDERLNHIVKEYGNLDRSQLIEAIGRLQKKLGGLETKLAIQYLMDGEIRSSFRILLEYYDKYYKRALEKKKDLLKRYVVVDNNQCDYLAVTEKLLNI